MRPSFSFFTTSLAVKRLLTDALLGGRLREIPTVAEAAKTSGTELLCHVGGGVGGGAVEGLNLSP